MSTSPAQLGLAPLAVPYADFLPSTKAPQRRHAEKRLTDAFETALEIEGRAAWLAWQIGADQASAREARNQLAGIADELARCGGELSDDLRPRISEALQTAQAAAMIDELPAVEQAAMRIREMVEGYRDVVFA